MAKKIIKAQMKQRRDTLENWAAVNPVLLDGELGFIEGFNDRFKVGDGKTAWNDLSYFSGSFDPSGTYPDLTAGDLAGRGESVPASFGFRASGGKSIKDGRAYIKRIKGNSVVWNQWALKNADSYTASGVTATWDGEKIHLQGVFNAEGDKNIYSMIHQLSLRIGHKYALILRGGQYASFYLSKGFVYPSIYREVILEANGENCDITLRVDALASAGQSIDEYVTMQVTDLTKMFQAGNEPSTIEEFNARVATLGVDMYAYNEGEVIHCNTESIKSVGDNAWDEQWEQGTIQDSGNIPPYSSPNDIRTINYIRVLPTETYYVKFEGSDLYIKGFFYDRAENYVGSNGFDFSASTSKPFVVPENAELLKFRIYKSTGGITPQDAPHVMLTLVHSGWKQDTDAGYQPYWQDTLPLPIISKYFPDGMKKAGSAHDEIRYNKASGKWEYSKGRIKSVDLGDLDWSYHPAADGYPFGFFYADPQGRKHGEKNILCGKYAFGYFADDKSILGNKDGKNIYLMDSAYTDAASLKASLQGVMFYYEAAEWEWVELDAEDQNFRDYYQVADFGTEQSQSNVPSAAFSADIIYQFNAVDMIREHEAEINELQSIIATMQAQLTSLINK